MDVTLSAILLSWKWRSDVALVVGALGTVYLVGWYRLRCLDPRGAPGWRLALYFGGLVALVLRCSLRSTRSALSSSLPT